jgi:hypothetical protein
MTCRFGRSKAFKNIRLLQGWKQIPSGAINVKGDINGYGTNRQRYS